MYAVGAYCPVVGEMELEGPLVVAISGMAGRLGRVGLADGSMLLNLILEGSSGSPFIFSYESRLTRSRKDLEGRSFNFRKM